MGILKLGTVISALDVVDCVYPLLTSFIRESVKVLTSPSVVQFESTLVNVGVTKFVSLSVTICQYPPKVFLKPSEEPENKIKL